MPYFLFLIGVIIGILSMYWEIPGILAFCCMLALLMYGLLFQQFKCAAWLLTLFFGLVFGGISGIKYMRPVTILGTECEGYILKEYSSGVSVRADRCSTGIDNPGVYYVACASKSCLSLYSRVRFFVSDTEKLGRFEGSGKLLENAELDKNSARMVYYSMLTAGNTFRHAYFFWLKSQLPAEQSALITSMLFGDTELPTSLIEKMKGVGLLHIVAISGINITYLLLLVQEITKRFSRNQRVLFEVIILFLLYFVVGEAVSLIRAIIMSFLGIFTKTVGLRPSRWGFALGLSLVLIIDANYLWDAGFLLVSGACVGVYIGGDYVVKHVKNGVLKVLAQGLLIWLCVAPVQLLLFGNVTVVGVFLSIFLGPIVEVLTLVGYISVFVQSVPYIGYLAKIILGIEASLILLVIDLFHAA